MVELFESYFEARLRNENSSCSQLITEEAITQTVAVDCDSQTSWGLLFDSADSCTAAVQALGAASIT